MSATYTIFLYNFGPEGGIVTRTANFYRAVTPETAVQAVNDHLTNYELPRCQEAYRAEAVA